MQLLKTKSGRLLAVILTGILFWIAWPSAGLAPILFIALVPLLLVEDFICKEKLAGRKTGLFWYSYLGFLIFNILTTWWIYFASPFGAVGAIFANALLMSITFQLFHIAHQKLGDKYAYIVLIIFWITFEYFHLNWDLSWPWLTFGNGFASWINMVQWYEYTGVEGGTLWVLLVNILIAKIILAEKNKRKEKIILVSFVLIIPLLFSAIIRINYKEEIHPIEVVVVQPNVDPYNEKFSGAGNVWQLEKILKLASPFVTSKTRLIVCPETALPDGIWEQNLNHSPEIENIRSFIYPFPGLRYLTGLTSYQIYYPNQPKSLTARAFPSGAGSFDAYNAAMQIEADTIIQLHHKSKLVPGVEKMPFPMFFKYFENFAIDLGGTSGSLGVQEHPSVFTGDSIIAAPVICYESIYGDYLSEYVREGANIICIMTNDGWWKKTPGYRQHCQYARLRAVEHRRSIARSANTGTSCFINQLGDVSQATEWWVPAVIRQELNLNNKETFYSQNGDYLGRFAIYLSAPILLILVIINMKKKKG